MSNELKITDLVDPKAIQDLENLRKKIEDTYNSYEKFVTLLAAGIKERPSNLQELSGKSENYNKVLSKIIDTQNRLSELYRDRDKLVKETIQQSKEHIAQILAESKANEKNAEAELKHEKAMTEKLRQQKLLNQEKKKTKITTAEAISLLNKGVHSINEAREQNKLLRAAVAQVTDAEDQDRKIRTALNTQIATNTEYIRYNTDAYTRQKMAIGNYRNEIKAALSEIKKGNKAFKNLGIVAKGFGGILKEEVTGGLNQVRIGVGSMIKGMVGAQAILSGIRSLIGLFKQGIQSAIEFEAANSKLAAVLGTTSKNLKEMESDARRLGSVTKYTASEVTGLQIELAKLGFSRKEILQSTEGVLKFAQATGAELPEAAALAGASLRMFNADTKETARYVSAMAVSTTKSALSFSYLQSALPTVGPVAKSFNFQIEDTLALLGKLADAGFDASSAATATRNILLNLADSNGKLAKSLGGNVKTLPELVAGLKKLEEQGVDLNTTLELTDKRSVSAFNAFLSAADGIIPLREQITGVTGELNDMANEMGNNVKGSLAGLSSAWESFMLSFGKSNGVIKEVIDSLSGLVRSMRTVFMTAEELGEERIENAARSGQKAAEQDREWIKSKEESIERVALKYRKEGVDGAEAFEKARVEQLKILERTLSQEEARLQLYTKRNERQWNTYNNRSFWKQGIHLQESTSRMKKDINESFALMEEQAGYIASLKEKMEQIRGLKNEYKEEDNSIGKITLPPTDKEKEELEKQAKEKRQIREAYQQSELELMDEGLEKELAKIRLNYTKRIASIKGYSEEEIKTRENLGIAMQRELAEKTDTYNQAKEKQELQRRLDVLTTNSDEELEIRLSLQLRMNEILEDAEVKEAKKRGDDVTLVTQKYEKLKKDIIEKNILERVGLIEKGTSKETGIVQEAENQLRKIEMSHRKGEINEREYRQKTYEITKDSILAQLELLNTQLQAELSVLDPADKNSDSLKEKIGKVRGEIRKLQTELEDLTHEKESSDRKDWADGFIDAMQEMRSKTEEYLGDTASLFGSFYNVISKMTEKFAQDGKFSLSEWWEGLDPTEKASMILKSFGELFSGITSIVTSALDTRIGQIEKEQEENEKAKDEEIERIEQLAERGAISTEEAEARKRAAEDRTAQKNKELERQKAELEQRQAKWNKANSIIQTTIATSVAIMQAFAEAGPIAGAILAAVIGAMGAAQVAIIASQPIPKYAKGTDNHPGGLAIVGDGGKQEVIETKEGAYITPSVPTLVNIPKRAKVIPDVVDYRKMMLYSDALMLDKRRRGSEEPVIVNVNNDYSRLEKTANATKEEIAMLNRTFRRMARRSNYQIISSRV